MAKLTIGNMPRAALYSTCLPGWLNMRLTSKQNVPRVTETRKVSVVSQKNVRISPYKFCHALMFPSLAKPLEVVFL